jgi:predicted DNA-binding WGR domain protein
MNKKWALLKQSDSGPMGRGQSGKKKVYEITVDGRTVTFEWGMAELKRRQTQVRTFSTDQAALSAAYEKLDAKLGRGYTIAYAV